MSLSVKFNLILVTSFIIGIIITAFLLQKLLQEDARETIQHNAELIMESAMAVRSYTLSEVQPILAPAMHEKFFPQSVPSYAASQNIRRLREKYPEYSYKEATLNPTNGTNRATDWETSVIEHFRNNPTETKLIGEHQTAIGKALYVAHPIQISSEGCLLCHGERDDAPKSMLAHYTSGGGFGWKLNEIVGVQMVTVPMSVTLDRANYAIRAFLLSISAVFVLILVLLNILLYLFVIRPVKSLSSMATDVSMGDGDVPEFKTKGSDELSTLGESFNRMRRSLDKAMKMLDE